MHATFRGLLLTTILFVSYLPAATLVRFDFEGIAPVGEDVDLFDQAPGATFVGYEVWVRGKAPAYAVSSGTDAALIYDGHIEFSTPVMQLSAQVTFSQWVHEGLSLTAPLDFIAYDVNRNERARVRLELPLVAASEAELAASRPTLLVISSPVPIAYLDYRYTRPFYMDDLSFVPATRAELTTPLPPPTPWLPGSLENIVVPSPINGMDSVLLRDQIPGITFLYDMSSEAGYVFDPAGHGANSGYAAARVFNGTYMRFATAASRVVVHVASYDIGRNMRADLVGYDRAMNERARATGVAGLVPARIELTSEVPLKYVTFRSGGDLFVDDIDFSVASQAAREAPLPPPLHWKPGSFDGMWGPIGNFGWLTDQIPGVSFLCCEQSSAVRLHEVPLLWNSAMLPLCPATSGGGVASGYNPLMRFSKPVVRVSAKVSPNEILQSDITRMRKIEMIGYNDQMVEQVRSAVFIHELVATIEEIAGYAPQKLEIASEVPLTYVQLVGGEIFFDDLEFAYAQYQFQCTSAPLLDGFVVEGDEHSNLGAYAFASSAGPAGVRAGDTGLNQQLKGIFSFNTRPLPDHVKLVSAKLYLKRGVTYGNPLEELGACRVDVKTDKCFSGSPMLQASDFQALPSGARVATLSQSGPLEGWDVLNVDAKGLRFINKAGVTQFRIYFDSGDNDDLAPDYIGWCSGDHPIPENRPVLQVVYE